MKIYAASGFPKLITNTFMAKLLPQAFVFQQYLLPKCSGESFKRKHADQILPSFSAEGKYGDAYSRIFLVKRSKRATTTTVGHRKLFQLDITHAATTGETPLQKKFQLGGTSVLRGYPQHTILSDEHLLASRLDFKYPLITAPLWGFVSAFKIQGTVFYDQGKIWSQGDSYEKAKLRKNAGMGIEWTIDTASLIQVPLKFEVAFPMDVQKPNPSNTNEHSRFRVYVICKNQFPATIMRTELLPFSMLLPFSILGKFI